MKATGIVRRVDELGRIVLPIEMRRTLDIAEKDALEISRMKLLQQGITGRKTADLPCNIPFFHIFLQHLL